MSTLNGFSQAFSEWLAKHPHGKRNLCDLGMQPGFIESMLKGEYDERILFMHADKIEQVTGLDICTHILLGAKRQLWGKDDHLPHIQSHTDLIRRAQAVVHDRGYTTLEIALNTPNSHTALKKQLQGKRRMSSDRVMRLLKFLNGEQNPTTAAVNTDSAQPTKTVTEIPGADKRARNVVSSTVSTLNSVLKILENAVDPTQVLDGDRTRVIDAARRLLKVFGIDQRTMRRLLQPDLTKDLDTDTLKLLTELSGKTRNKT